MITWKEVVAMARDLPEVERGRSMSTPALNVRGKSFAWRRGTEGGLVLYCSLATKEALVTSGNPAYYTIPHHKGHGTIIVDLKHVEEDKLWGLLVESWRRKAPASLRDKWDESAR
ncbi:MmcQ/YjbR family DNA-binding protein [Spiractinospora alimapuensis]|uniref:MmcQ/YjbR family DNA-binding protein n=1 Tax=Spiractinospora alimapuensis TaxID=2820884 RepID=UPI001F1C746B|nr:MmcQ/YjbR family DNA-binding protein [Spiractinospora alimapuensis]QVQ54316.1 MmcQ/YjbR family DNA-binding protein [Spiractinospora alimapuensis]